MTTQLKLLNYKMCNTLKGLKMIIIKNYKVLNWYSRSIYCLLMTPYT